MKKLIALLLWTALVAETTIYGPQRWVDGAILEPSGGPGYYSTTEGGSDAPVSGYPELKAMENLERVAAAGPEGQNVVDADDTSDYATSGFRLLGLGALSGGQFDFRDGGDGTFHARLRCQLKASAMLDVEYAAPMILLSGGVAGAGGNGSSDWVVVVEMYQDSGANFQWDVTYRRVNGAFFTATELNPTLSSAPDVADDRWVEVDVEVVPSTITGAYNGSGGVGSAIAANDGAITLRVDDVIVLQATGIALAINRFATAQPNIYYGRGIQVGDQQFGGGADMPGPVTDVELYYESSEPDPPTPPTRPAPQMVNSTPCCGGGNAEAGTNAGPVLPFVGPDWTPSCEDGGDVPTAADLVLTERWDY